MTCLYYLDFFLVGFNALLPLPTIQHNTYPVQTQPQRDNNANCKLGYVPEVV